MLATITKMQTQKKPYNITLVPLYSTGDPVTITVSNEQSDFVFNQLACGDTINYEKDKNLLLGIQNGQEYGYDRMLVEDIGNGIELSGIKYQTFHLFGKSFGNQIIKMYSNPYKIKLGHEVLVKKIAEGDSNYQILHNFSIAEQRRNLLNKNR